MDSDNFLEVRVMSTQRLLSTWLVTSRRPWTREESLMPKMYEKFEVISVQHSAG
jgi:hypothetical protein